MTEWARKADLLFNLSGHLTLPQLKDAPACRVYYDDDPGFTQFWRAAGHVGARLEGHDGYFTLGANIGAADCPIPTDGIAWRHTRPPVVLGDWPVVEVESPQSKVQSPKSGAQNPRTGAAAEGLTQERGLLSPALSSVEGNREKAFARFTTVASWRGAYGPVQYRRENVRVKGP